MYPQARIVMIAPKMVRTICPEGTLYDTFWDWDTTVKNKLNYPFLLFKIARLKPDLAVNLHITSDGNTFLAWATTANYVTGFGPPNLHFLYTHHPPKPTGKMHEYEKLNGIITSLGWPEPREMPVVWYSQDHKSSLQNKLDNAGLRLRQDATDGYKPYIIVSPTASSPTKAWPLQSFVTVAQQLALAYPDFEVIATYGPNELNYATEFVNLVAMPNVNLAPAVNVNELAVLTEGAALLVCNNSGIMNMAMATKTPQVVASCTKPEDWGALGPYDVTLYPTNLTAEESHQLDWGKDEQFRMRMMGRISVDEVWQACQQVMRHAHGISPKS